MDRWLLPCSPLLPKVFPSTQDGLRGIRHTPGPAGTTTPHTDPPPRLHPLGTNWRPWRLKLKLTITPERWATRQKLSPSLGRQCTWAEVHGTGGLVATLAVSGLGRRRATRPRESASAREATHCVVGTTGTRCCWHYWALQKGHFVLWALQKGHIVLWALQKGHTVLWVGLGA